MEERRRWYGWQTLIVHGVAATSMLVLLPATSGDATPFVIPSAIAAATLGGPIVHWAHGKVGTGFASLGLNIGMTFAGSLLGATVGAIGEMATDNSRHKDGELGFFIGALMGIPFGAATAFAMDLSILSFEEERVVARPEAESLSVMPLVRVDGERAVFGLGGTF